MGARFVKVQRVGKIFFFGLRKRLNLRLRFLAESSKYKFFLLNFIPNLSRD